MSKSAWNDTLASWHHAAQVADSLAHSLVGKRVEVPEGWAKGVTGAVESVAARPAKGGYNIHIRNDNPAMRLTKFAVEWQHVQEVTS